MLQKLKNWFSVENNVNLIRDSLFVGSLLAALIFGLFRYSALPVAYAAESEVEDLFCLTIPSYEVGDTTYAGISVKIPYEYTDKIFAYHSYDELYILAIDVLDSTEDCYVSIYDSGTAGQFSLYGASKIGLIIYTYDGSDLVLVHNTEKDNSGSADGSIFLNTFRSEFSDFEIVYATSDILDSSDDSVYFYASNSFASLMDGLFSFGGSVVHVWDSISDFANDNIYVFLPLIAWLLVMAVGGLFKLFKS